MKDTNIFSLDLEYNQPSNTIIQVGYVIGNLKSGEIIEKKQHNVYTEEDINPYITTLTGITTEDVRNGENLVDIYQEIKDLHIRYNCFRNCLTWGGGDSLDLRSSLDLDDEMFVFGRRWVDVKTLFVSYCFANNMKTQSGLAKSLIRMGSKFEGNKHTAADDAYNTFLMYRILLEELKINEQ